jgi:hypothetical protein
MNNVASLLIIQNKFDLLTIIQELDAAQF